MHARVTTAAAVAGVLCSIPALLWHVTQFLKPGPEYFALLCASIAALAAAALAYARFRGRLRHELFWLAAAPAAVVAAYRPASALLGVAIAGSAWLLGAAILRRLRFEAADCCEALALPALAGLGVLTLALFCLGTAGLFFVPAFVAVIVAAALLGWREAAALRAALGRASAAWAEEADLRRPLASAAIVYMFALTLLTAVVAVLPTNVGDAVALHLPLARTYAESRGMRPPATMPYGWFPQAFEAWAALAVSLGGLATAQIVSVLFSALGALMLASVLRKCGLSRAATLTGMALAASIPFAHWALTVPKNDSLMAGWEMAALLCVLRCRMTGAFRWIALSVAFAGLAFQVKHVALFGAVPLAVLWAYALSQQKRRAAKAVLLCAVFVVFGTFSVARAWLATGNPVYPENATRSVRPIGHRTLGERAVRWVSLPLRLQFDGVRYSETSSPNPVGIAFLVLMIPALIRYRRSAPNACFRIAATFAGGYLLYWSVVAPVPRYALPAFALAAGLLGGGVWEWSRTRREAVAAAAYVLAFGWVVCVMIESYPPAVSWLSRRIDDSTYLRRTLPGYGAMHFLARNAGAADATLSVGDSVLVYGPDPARVLLHYRDDRLYSAQEVRAMFAAVNYRWLVLPNDGNGPQLAAATASVKPIEHVYGDEWFSVFRVASSR